MPTQLGFIYGFLITAHPMKDYIAVKENHAVFLPHTAGRYAAKRFRKSQASYVVLDVLLFVMLSIYSVPLWSD